MIQQAITSHNSDLSQLVSWFWLALMAILPGVLSAYWLLGSILPARSTATESAEKARKSQQAVAELEREVIEELDAQLYSILQAISELRDASDFDSQHAQDDADPDPVPSLLQRLDKEAERLVSELYRRNRVYDVAVARLKRIEEAARKAGEFEDDRDYWDFTYGIMKLEKEKVAEESKEAGEDDSCGCIIQ